MSMNNRNCMQNGHEMLQATHICIAKDCKEQKKWCCIQCINIQGIHNHNQENSPHIIPWQDILSKKKEEIIQFQQCDFKCYLKSCNSLISRGLEQCQQIYKFLQEYQCFMQQQIQKIEKDKITLEEIISDLNEDNFIQLNDQRLYEILYFNKNKFINNKKSLIKPLDKISHQINQLETTLKEYYEHNSKINGYIDIKQIQYQVKQIDETNSIYNASSISNNEQYLAYGGDNCVLKIYDIKLEKLIKEIQADQNIYACQFTNNSSQLFVGMSKGYVYGYDVLIHFKLIFKQQIHQDQVSNIKIVQNLYLITCSSDRTIIKTDIKRKSQMFKYTIHTEFIVAIDYDEINDMIISGSHDKSIKLWNCKTQSTLISKEQSHPKQVRQIQLVNNYQNVLSLDSDNNLYKWRIDLIKKDLLKIQEFRDPNKIYNFCQINLDLSLILICGQQIKILDEQGETINSINHQAGDFNSWMMDCKQPDNGKFIVIRSKQKLLLATQLT